MSASLVAMTPAARAAGAGRGNALAGIALAAALLAALAGVLLMLAGLEPRIERSDSMRPAIGAGDLVWLRNVRARDAEPGDIVAFADEDRGRTVMHRVEAIDARRGELAFTTRGDANTGGERWRIARDGRIGRYAGIRLPYAGRVAAALQGPLTASLAATALALLALNAIWTPRRRSPTASRSRRTRRTSAPAPT